MAEQQARALQAVREAEKRAEKEKEAALSAAAEKQRDREQREQVQTCDQLFREPLMTGKALYI
jgi:hypothetical protein